MPLSGGSADDVPGQDPVAGGRHRTSPSRPAPDRQDHPPPLDAGDWHPTAPRCCSRRTAGPDSSSKETQRGRASKPRGLSSAEGSERFAMERGTVMLTSGSGATGASGRAYFSPVSLSVHPRRQRPPAQPEGHHRRPAAPGADRRHRPVRVGQELPGLRHPLRRGPAAVHRVAVDLRQAVPRADAQAAGRPDRGHRTRRGHRAAEPDGLQLAPRSAPPPRSTTYLRLLWARVGRQYCRSCGGPVRRDTPAVGRRAAPRPAVRCRSQVAFPLAGLGPAGSRRDRREPPGPRLRPAPGRRPAPPPRRAAPDRPGLDAVDDLLVVVDRIRESREQRNPGWPSRWPTAFAEGEGVAVVLHPEGRLRFTEHPACSRL